MENLSRVFQKQKRKKNMERLSFMTHFKIEFLLPFNGLRRVLKNAWYGAFVTPLCHHNDAVLLTEEIATVFCHLKN